MINRISAFCPIISLLFLVVAGCGEPRATVSGIVTYDGRPLPGGTVIFVSEDGKKQDSATIDSEGKYSATMVPIGNNKVAVVPGPKSLKDSMPKGAKGGGKKPDIPDDNAAGKAYQSSGTYVDIPIEYRDPDSSDLTVTTKSGSQEFNIPLKKKAK